MKKILFFISFILPLIAWAQRPATREETAEDLRVLQALSDAMPKEIKDWKVEDGSESKMEGTSGWYNNMDFSSKDIYDHYYKISYKRTGINDEKLSERISTAKTAADFAYIENATRCDIEILVNSNKECNRANTPFKKLSSAYCQNVYRDEANNEYTLLFFGKNWTFTPATFENDDNKEYCLKSNPHTTFGTAIQSIKIIIKGNAAIADSIIKYTDWKKINGLLGSGQISEDNAGSDLKKYFIEKPIAPVSGANNISYTLVYEDGTSKDIVITSAKHDLSNGARLRNHNPNPKMLQFSRTDIYLSDDKNTGLSFHFAVPIVRSTGTVTASYQSNYDYSVMWNSNLDESHTIFPENMVITITKWAPVGGYIEGTFSGTGTLKDHNDFSSTRPGVTIKNGKFRVRRINDEIK